MAIKIMVILAILVSLCGLLEANENCQTYQNKVSKNDYPQYLAIVQKKTGKTFSVDNVKYLTYGYVNGDIKYCCNVVKVSGNSRTECTVAWSKSGQSISSSCQSSSFR